MYWKWFSFFLCVCVFLFCSLSLDLYYIRTMDYDGTIDSVIFGEPRGFLCIFIYQERNTHVLKHIYEYKWTIQKHILVLQLSFPIFRKYGDIWICVVILLWKLFRLKLENKIIQVDAWSKFKPETLNKKNRHLRGAFLFCFYFRKNHKRVPQSPLWFLISFNNLFFFVVFNFHVTCES